jgi:predicted peptidase
MKRSYGMQHMTLIVAHCIILCFLSACKKETGSNHSTTVSDSVQIVLTGVTHSVNERIAGYYVGLPSNYYETNQTYPLLVYMPGAGQFGNGSSDLPLLLNDGVLKTINNKAFPGSFIVGGKSYSFIVFTPQVRNFPDANDVNDCIAFAKKTWRIDGTRIYASGLSAGSIASCDLAAQSPSEIAALVAMAGVPQDYSSTNKCQRIAAARLPVWVFHSEDDPQISISVAKGFVAKVASLLPAIPPKLTVWPNGGHDAWTRAVDPSYKENGLNIYEWMLQYHR